MSPRLRMLDRSEMSRTQTLLVDTCTFNGAPDALIASIFTRSEIGRIWLRAWNEVLNGGIVPVEIKEMCRVLLSTRHQCGYCSTVRSRVAASEGLSEEKLMATIDFENSPLHSEREKAALRFALLFHEGDESLDSDKVFDDIKVHFNEEEIIELALLCGETTGVGKFARALQVRTWDEACEIQPRLRMNLSVAEAAE